MEQVVRQPAVAGAFYPAGAASLEREVREMITECSEQCDLLGCISPHAGYVYSGSVAGQLFGTLQVPRRVVILCPNHTGLGRAVAVAPHRGWQTPLGTVGVDQDLARQLLAEYPEAQLDADAHAREHSAEVQLPFLKVRRPDVRVLPVCLKHLTLDQCRELGQALARIVASSPEPVGLVASSDMSHFLSEEETRKLDQLAIDAALTRQPEALYETVHRHRISMCGVVPATAVLAAGVELGATRAELVAYATSGDINLNRSEVVGYAAIRLRSA